MSAARRNDDPLRSSRQALVAPISRESDMVGGGTSGLSNLDEPMLDHKGADDRMLRNARSESMIVGQHGEAPSQLPWKNRVDDTSLSVAAATAIDEARHSLTCDRMDYRKRCSTCGKRTHLRFDRGGLVWYRCRKDLTDNEKHAFEYCLWRDRKRRDSLAYRREKVDRSRREYKLDLATRAEVGQDAA